MDNQKLNNIIEKIILATKTNKIIYSNEFYTNDLYEEITYNCNKNFCKCYFYGVFKEAQRKMVAFSSYDEENIEYPIDLLQIKASSKFVNLNHKDFLGSIMALGIKREKMGDLLLEDNICYVPICKDMTNFIKINLNHINKSPCNIKVLDIFTEKIPQYKFEEKIINVNSIRLDSLVSGICNISRSKAFDIIKKGCVLVNYNIVLEKDCKLENGNVITIRGYGKYIVESILGYTQRERMKILIKKFI